MSEQSTDLTVQKIMDGEGVLQTEGGMTGMLAYEDENGSIFYASPDVVKNLKTFKRLIGENATLYNLREKLSNAEAEYMAGRTLVWGQRVVAKKLMRKGIVIKVDTGAFSRPVYMIELDHFDQPLDVVRDTAMLYARDLMFNMEECG